MAKFKIPILPSTTQRSIRFPNDLIKEVEEAICGKESTFSAFVVAATRYAIEELKEKNENTEWNRHFLKNWKEKNERESNRNRKRNRKNNERE